MNIYTKVISIIGIGLSLFILLIVILFLLKPKNINPVQNSQSQLTATPVPTEPVMISINPTEAEETIERNQNTGFDISSLPSPQAAIGEQGFRLRSILPYKTSKFMIEYDYSNALYDVVVAEPYDENLASFKKWLVDEGYKDIPPSDFSYTSAIAISE